MLSCADHALSWQSAGHEVRVLTLFSAAGPWISPVLGLPNRDLAAGEAWMELRRAEDYEALKRLGFCGEHLGLVDAGFRGEQGPYFPDHASLLSGRYGPGGEALVAQAVQALHVRVPSASWVVAPLAVGGHVDHVITRLACEAAVPRHSLVYYADMPYARAPWRWSVSTVHQALVSRRSWHWITARKQQVLAAYASQMPLLFRRSPQFPEFLLWQQDQTAFGLV